MSTIAAISSCFSFVSKFTMTHSLAESLSPVDRVQAEYFDVSYLMNFVKFIENNMTIQLCLKTDKCHLLADNYLLAMTFAYFIRSKLDQYNLVDFFTALHIAHDMEEDDPILKRNIVNWATHSWEDEEIFYANRRRLLEKMNFRVGVSREVCEMVMNIGETQNAEIWTRKRNIEHGGATRNKSKSNISCTFCQGDSQEDRMRRYYRPYTAAYYSNSASQKSSQYYSDCNSEQSHVEDIDEHGVAEKAVESINFQDEQEDKSKLHKLIETIIIDHELEGKSDATKEDISLDKGLVRVDANDACEINEVFIIHELKRKGYNCESCDNNRGISHLSVNITQTSDSQEDSFATPKSKASHSKSEEIIFSDIEESPDLDVILTDLEKHVQTVVGVEENIQKSVEICEKNSKVAGVEENTQKSVDICEINSKKLKRDTTKHMAVEHNPSEASELETKKGEMPEVQLNKQSKLRTVNSKIKQIFIKQMKAKIEAKSKRKAKPKENHQKEAEGEVCKKTSLIEKMKRNIASKLNTTISIDMDNMKELDLEKEQENINDAKECTGKKSIIQKECKIKKEKKIIKNGKKIKVQREKKKKLVKDAGRRPEICHQQPLVEEMEQSIPNESEETGNILPDSINVKKALRKKVVKKSKVVTSPDLIKETEKNDSDIHADHNKSNELLTLVQQERDSDGNGTDMSIEYVTGLTPDKMNLKHNNKVRDSDIEASCNLIERSEKRNLYMNADSSKRGKLIELLASIQQERASDGTATDMRIDDVTDFPPDKMSLMHNNNNGNDIQVSESNIEAFRGNIDVPHNIIEVHHNNIGTKIDLGKVDHDGKLTSNIKRKITEYFAYSIIQNDNDRVKDSLGSVITKDDQMNDNDDNEENGIVNEKDILSGSKLTKEGNNHNSHNLFNKPNLAPLAADFFPMEKILRSDCNTCDISSIETRDMNNNLTSNQTCQDKRIVITKNTNEDVSLAISSYDTEIRSDMNYNISLALFTNQTVNDITIRNEMQNAKNNGLGVFEENGKDEEKYRKKSSEVTGGENITVDPGTNNEDSGGKIVNEGKKSDIKTDNKREKKVEIDDEVTKLSTALPDTTQKEIPNNSPYFDERNDPNLLKTKQTLTKNIKLYEKELQLNNCDYKTSKFSLRRASFVKYSCLSFLDEIEEQRSNLYGLQEQKNCAGARRSASFKTWKRYTGRRSMSLERIADIGLDPLQLSRYSIEPFRGTCLSIEAAQEGRPCAKIDMNNILSSKQYYNNNDQCERSLYCNKTQALEKQNKNIINIGGKKNRAEQNYDKSDRNNFSTENKIIERMEDQSEQEKFLLTGIPQVQRNQSDENIADTTRKEMENNDNQLKNCKNYGGSHLNSNDFFQKELALPVTPLGACDGGINYIKKDKDIIMKNLMTIKEILSQKENEIKLLVNKVNTLETEILPKRKLSVDEELTPEKRTKLEKIVDEDIVIIKENIVHKSSKTYRLFPSENSEDVPMCENKEADDIIIVKEKLVSKQNFQMTRCQRRNIQNSQKKLTMTNLEQINGEYHNGHKAHSVLCNDSINHAQITSKTRASSSGSNISTININIKGLKYSVGSNSEKCRYISAIIRKDPVKKEKYLHFKTKIAKKSNCQ